MIISILCENTSPAGGRFTERFGLGMLIEANGSKTMIDCGPDGSFLQNLGELGMSAGDIDQCAITHGHYDHGGGLRAFIEHNHTAKIYLSAHCWDEFYSNNLQSGEYKNISLDRTLLTQYPDRFVAVNSDLEIGGNIILNAISVQPGQFYPKMNANLYAKRAGIRELDDFRHETAIVIRENEKCVVVSGCAHSGVTNMLDTVIKKNNLTRIDALIGGFHFVNPGTKKLGEPEENIVALAKQLEHYRIGRILSGHCTGEDGLRILKQNYAGTIEALTTGFVAEI